MSLTPRLDKLDAGRNLIINGNFDFWQRATTFTRTALPAHGAYSTADRWLHNQGGGTTSFTVDRQSDVPTVVQSSFQSVYSIRYLNSASTGTWLAFGYAVEGYDYQAIHARSFRLQFWVKASVAGTYGVTLQNNADTRAYSTTYTVSTANVWQKVALDIVADSAGTWLFDNAKGLQIWWVINNGTSVVTATTNNVWESTSARQPSGSFAAFGTTVGATFQIAQVALYPGEFTSDHDLPFQRAGRTISDELAMCQRYYEKSYDIDVVPGDVTGEADRGRIFQTTITHSNNNAYLSVQYKVPKRSKTHTITFYSSGSATPNIVERQINGAAGTTPTIAIGAVYYSTTGATGYTGTTAGDRILYLYHYTADAEL